VEVLLVVLAGQQQLHGGVDEEGAEDVEDPVEGREGGGAGGDADGAQHHRDDEVVDAEAVLGHVAGDELARRLAPAKTARPPAKRAARPT